MITIIDCIKAASIAIEEAYGAAPITKDVQEGYERPGTYIYPTSIISTQEGALQHDQYTLEITRFSECDYLGYLELLKYKADMQAILGRYIPVTDTFYIYPTEQNYSIDTADYALTVTFSVDVYQLIEDSSSETAELMRELHTKREETD